MDAIQVNDIVESNRHGGARRGAGRHKLDYDARYFAARGISPLMAGEILARVADERRIWKRILESSDDRVVLQAMMFLVSMRDGKPSQQINVTSTQLTINAESVQKARAIVAEIRATSLTPSLGDGSSGTIPLTPADDIVEVRRAFAVEEKANIMLSGAEGGQKDG